MTPPLRALNAPDLPDPETGDSTPHQGGVRVEAEAALPSEFGDFRIVAFSNDHDGKEHIALVKGEVRGATKVPLRVHSECLTGDVLGSLRCDCRQQLLTAMERVGQEERGVVLYLRQEGRGIGLINKIRAYSLQDGGLDTVDANRALGFEDDERTYGVAAGMIQALGIDSIRLLTNNPDKIEQLRDNGVTVSGRIPHEMPTNHHNRFYLETKRARAGHLLLLSDDAEQAAK